MVYVSSIDKIVDKIGHSLRDWGSVIDTTDEMFVVCKRDPQKNCLTDILDTSSSMCWNKSF